MKILSWNIKNFTSTVKSGKTVYRSRPSDTDKAFNIILKVMNTFDLISIYEIANSANGATAAKKLLAALNATSKKSGSGRDYAARGWPSGGVGAENDQVGIFYDQNRVTVQDTTNERRGPNKTGYRMPIYFNVTEKATGKTCEFCALHAPEPGEGDAIGQTWRDVKNNCIRNGSQLTQLIMGDFNCDSTRDPEPVYNMKHCITQGATTFSTDWKIDYPPDYIVISKYLTNNLYDQFYVAINGGPRVNESYIYDIPSGLAYDFRGIGTLVEMTFKTLGDACNFYRKYLSDHLPVALDLTL